MPWTSPKAPASGTKTRQEAFNVAKGYFGAGGSPRRRRRSRHCQHRRRQGRHRRLRRKVREGAVDGHAGRRKLLVRRRRHNRRPTLCRLSDARRSRGPGSRDGPRRIPAAVALALSGVGQRGVSGGRRRSHLHFGGIRPGRRPAAACRRQAHDAVVVRRCAVESLCDEHLLQGDAVSDSTAGRNTVRASAPSTSTAARCCGARSSSAPAA